VKITQLKPTATPASPAVPVRGTQGQEARAPRERLDLYQRELLLDTVIQTTPLVMVLTNSVGRIVYSNIAARQLFHGGRKLEGLDFPALLADSPPPLRDALRGDEDTLFKWTSPASRRFITCRSASFI
jgi:PAS domain-containing protein